MNVGTRVDRLEREQALKDELAELQIWIQQDWGMGDPDLFERDGEVKRRSEIDTESPNVVLVTYDRGSHELDNEN